MATKKASRASDAILKELRAFGLAYPGAHTKSPWPGHLDLAVNDKTFAYLSVEGQPFSISCKLPDSASVALLLPFTRPTGYGLGKSGWVTATFEDGQDIPVDMLREWIDESYRAQAPKRLVATLGAGAGLPRAGAGERARAKKASGRTPAAKKATAKKAAGKKPASRRV